MSESASDRAVFLDRDGVLAETFDGGDGIARGPRDAAALRIPPDAASAVGALREAGYVLLVVTNQPDIARGATTPLLVDEIHAALARELPLDGFYVCPHDGRDGCDCRKPLPGLILRAATDWGIDLQQSWSIGDRWVDIAAANAAGVSAVLLDQAHSWLPTSAGPPAGDLRIAYSAGTLTECARFITGARRA